MLVICLVNKFGDICDDLPTQCKQSSSAELSRVLPILLENMSIKKTVIMWSREIRLHEKIHNFWQYNCISV